MTSIHPAITSSPLLLPLARAIITSTTNSPWTIGTLSNGTNMTRPSGSSGSVRTLDWQATSRYGSDLLFDHISDGNIGLPRERSQEGSTNNATQETQGDSRKAALAE